MANEKYASQSSALSLLLVILAMTSAFIVRDEIREYRLLQLSRTYAAEWFFYKLNLNLLEFAIADGAVVEPSQSRREHFASIGNVEVTQDKNAVSISVASLPDDSNDRLDEVVIAPKPWRSSLSPRYFIWLSTLMQNKDLGSGPLLFEMYKRERQLVTIAQQLNLTVPDAEKDSDSDPDDNFRGAQAYHLIESRYFNRSVKIPIFDLQLAPVIAVAMLAVFSTIVTIALRSNVLHINAGPSQAEDEPWLLVDPLGRSARFVSASWLAIVVACAPLTTVLHVVMLLVPIATSHEGSSCLSFMSSYWQSIIALLFDLGVLVLSVWTSIKIFRQIRLLKTVRESHATSCTASDSSVGAESVAD